MHVNDILPEMNILVLEFYLVSYFSLPDLLQAMGDHLHLPQEETEEGENGSDSNLNFEIATWKLFLGYQLKIFC